MEAWRAEFPDYPTEDMPVLPEGWVDASWHNDACPSFVNDKLRAALFTDYRDSKTRGLGLEGGARFIVFNMDDEGNIETNLKPLAAGDDIDAVLAELSAKRAA